MKTQIGNGLRSNAQSLWTTTALSVLVVGADLAIVATGWDDAGLRVALALLASLILALVASEMRDGAPFGFRVSLRPGWCYWAKATLVLGGILIAVLGTTGCVLFGVLRYPIPPSPLAATSQFGPLFVWMCVVSPLFEEVIYRLAVCPPAAAWLGPRGCILVSGTIFAGLHILYGNPSPENLLGGFILSWAFLKSGTLIVPIALHSLGNLGAFLCQLAHFYYN